MTKPWKAFLVLAAVLILSSLRMGVFAQWSTGVPPPAQWATEARGLYQPWLHRTSLAAGVKSVMATADAGARAWKLLALRINGQWDPRFLDFSAVCLFGLAVAVFLGAALAEAAADAALVIALATVALCLPVAMHDGMGAPSAWTGLFLLFSVLHLTSALARPGSGRWWLGHLAGLANVLSATAGLASPLSILAWMALRGDRRKNGQRLRQPLALANGVLAAVGVALIVGGRQGAPHLDFTHFARAAAWPFPWRTGVLITVTPAIALLLACSTCFARIRLIGGLETASTGQKTRNLSLACLAACWALASTAAIAGGAAPGGTIHPWLVCVILVVQVASLLALPAERAGAWTLKGLAIVIWLAIAVDGLARQGQPVANPTERARQADVETSAVRRYLADRRLGDLKNVFPPPARAEEIGVLLSDPRIEAILPPSLRPSLPLAASAVTRGFRPSEAPPEAGKPGWLPIWGTWGDAHAEPNARFVSAPLHTAAPILQIYIAGTLDPPANSLALETADGHLILPITRRADATVRWRTINFRAPKSPFRIVAAQSDPARILAFSAPIEAAGWPRLARAVCAAWKSILVCGVALALLAGAEGLAELKDDGAGFRRAIALFRTHGAWLALFCYSLVFAGSLDICAAGSDSSGYLNVAKLLLRGHLFPAPRWLPGVHPRFDMICPLGFAVHRGMITPSYPAGFPLMVAAVARPSSLSVAIPVVILLHLLLGVIATERLGRICGLSRPGALVAAAVVALCPIYIFSGLQPMTDVPSLAWVTVALYLALASRSRSSTALWAGAACGVAVFLRPANVICLLPVAVAIGASRPRLLRWAAGGLPAAALWAAYNFRVYGNPLVTGYGNAGYLFSGSWVLPSADNYARSLTACLSPLIWIAAAGPWARRLTAPARAALAACAICYLGFYAFYSCTHESWWILRFVLPAFPALTVLAAGAAESALTALARRASRAAISVATLLAAAAIVSVIVECVERPILDPARDDRVYRDLSLWIDRTAPKDAVVIAYQASGALFYYTAHPLLRAGRSTQPADADAIRAFRDGGTPVYAVIFPGDAVTSIGLLPGRWTAVATFGSAKIWKLSEGGRFTPGAAQSAGSASLFENTAGQIGPGRRG